MLISLKRYRISANMTKAELAYKAHVSKTHISNIERNRNFPSPTIIIRIAKALDVCPYNLLDFCTNCTLDCNNENF